MAKPRYRRLVQFRKMVEATWGRWALVLPNYDEDGVRVGIRVGVIIDPTRREPPWETETVWEGRDRTELLRFLLGDLPQKADAVDPHVGGTTE